MAITNFGYDGQISAVQFAGMMQHQGIVVPVVGGKDDFAVAANNSATLTCTVAPGVAYAPGVRTVSDSVISKTFDAVVTTGATRWDAVVLRRSWASGGSSTVEVVKGTASASAPPILPAGVDLVLDSSLDQVLALVQFTYGSTIPTAVLDRRVWANPVYAVPSVQALPPASAALYGMEAVVGADRYQCLTDTSNNPTWVRSEPTPITTSGTVNFTTTNTPGMSTTITFPAGRFATPPRVFVTRQGGQAKAIPYAVAATTSGATIGIYTGDGTNLTPGALVPVNWFATL